MIATITSANNANQGFPVIPKVRPEAPRVTVTAKNLFIYSPLFDCYVRRKPPQTSTEFPRIYLTTFIATLSRAVSRQSSMLPSTASATAIMCYSRLHVLKFAEVQWNAIRRATLTLWNLTTPRGYRTVRRPTSASFNRAVSNFCELPLVDNIEFEFVSPFFPRSAPV